jgi:hypothetical protein
LKQAIELGRRDWRDLLVDADFADDVHAHEHWTPRPLTPDIMETWTSGAEVEGIRFSRGSRVQVRRGELIGGVGTIQSLIALEPEPSYIVALEGGRQLRVTQFNLQSAD